MRNAVGFRKMSRDVGWRRTPTEIAPDFSRSGVEAEKALNVGADKDKSARDIERQQRGGNYLGRTFGPGPVAVAAEAFFPVSANTVKGAA
jgi:hypothetical protein